MRSPQLLDAKLPLPLLLKRNVDHRFRKTPQNFSTNRLHSHLNKVLNGAVHLPSRLFILGPTLPSLKQRDLISMRTSDLHWDSAIVYHLHSY